MARFQDKNGVVSKNGFFQKVAGSTPNSLTGANYYSTEQFVVIPFTYTTTTYTLTVPTTAILVEAVIAATTAFVGTTPAVNLGTTAGASDLVSQAFTSGTAAPFNPAVKLPAGVQASATPGVVYVTIAGTGLSAGAGYIMLGFLMPYQSVPV